MAQATNGRFFRLAREAVQTSNQNYNATQAKARAKF